MVSSGEVWPANVSVSRRVGLPCAIQILYGLAFHALFLLAAVFAVNASASIWYPPAGLRLAVLLIFGWRFGALIFCSEAIVGLALGMVDARGLTGAGASDLPLIAGLVAAIAIPPACYALAAFYIERRKRPEAGADPFMGILHFLFIVCLAGAASAVLATAELVISGFLSWSGFRFAVGARAIGDVIGILTLTPALLLAASRIKNRWMVGLTARPLSMAWVSGSGLAAGDAPTARALAEGATVCLFVAATLLAISDHTHHASAVPWYPFLLPVIWLALRFGLPAAIIGTFCMNLAAASAAVSFGEVETFRDVQIFMVALSVTGLLMGSVVSELHNEKATLDLRVRSRTHDLLDEIDRRTRAEDAALQEKQRTESYLAIAQPAIIALDRDARITLVNNSAIRLLGCQRAEILGRDWLEILGAGTEAGVEAERTRLRSIHRALIAEEPVEIANFETRVRGRDDEERLIDWRSAVIRGGDGAVLGILCSGDDITERVAAEEKLRHLASHDPVTGLHNRNWLLDHVPRATARACRHGGLLAVLFIDLTGFKQINDDYGHAQGDRTLLATALRLKQCVRATDMVTRLGGDEFVVLLEDVGEPADAIRIAEKILRTIAEPLCVDADAVSLGASIGIAFFPYDGKTTEELLSKADAAMYLAKRGQPHGYRVAPGYRFATGRCPTLEADAPARLETSGFSLTNG